MSGDLFDAFVAVFVIAIFCGGLYLLWAEYTATGGGSE